MTVTSRRAGWLAGKLKGRDRSGLSTTVTILDDDFVESVTTWEDGTEIKVIVGRGSLELPAPEHREPAWSDVMPARVG